MAEPEFLPRATKSKEIQQLLDFSPAFEFEVPTANSGEIDRNFKFAVPACFFDIAATVPSLASGCMMHETEWAGRTLGEVDSGKYSIPVSFWI